MEQIELGLIIVNESSRWSEDDELERHEKLASFPHSIPVATSFVEMDFVDEWLTNTIGPKRVHWEVLFYYKQAYDFGYAEYFFKEESSLTILKNQLPQIYGVFARGKRLRTDRQGEYFEADKGNQRI